MVEDADSSVVVVVVVPTELSACCVSLVASVGTDDEAVSDVLVEIVWIDDVVWSVSVVDDAVLSIVEEANSVDSAVNIFLF